jgi:creatinine amidohydrolase
MRPYILAETNWNALQSQRFDLAILPWGATEAHNYHLPYGTDNFEAELIAAESARIAWEKGAKVVVLPVIPYGVNTGQRDIYLDINMNPSTQQLILSDILDGLRNQGIFKFLILNSHGGNDFKPMLRELGLKFPDMFLGACNWFQALDKSQYFDATGDHADEMETSLILHLHPELVLPRDKWGDGTEKKNKIKAFRESWAWTERKWSEVTADTGIGNPAAATPEKGERYFGAVTQKVAELMYDLATTDPDRLYEE